MHSNKVFLALYEISMSIGNSMDLDAMLKEAVTVMLGRLNCSSAAIFQENSGSYKLLYSKPKVIIKNELYSRASRRLESSFSQVGYGMLVEEIEGRYYYLFELKNFGYLILTRSNSPFEKLLLNAMSKINLKLVSAIRACQDNRNLHKSREQLAEAQSIAHLGSWSMTLSPLKIMWDDELFRIFGAEPGSFEPTYNKILQYIPKREYSRLRKAFIEVLNRNSIDFEGTFEFCGETGECGYIQLKIRPVFDANGSLVKMVGTLLDITKQQKLEQRIRQESSLMKSIINTVPVRIFWKDSNLRFLGCNKLFVEDASLNDERDLIGKSDLDMVWKDEAEGYRANDRTIMASGKPMLNYEESQTQDNGRRIWVSSSKTPLKDGEGRIIGLVGAYMDITSIKESERKLKSHRDELQYRAYHDALTDLPNRLLFLDRLEQAINNARRSESNIAVLFVDLDRFKEINDSLGHAFGDKVIQVVAARLKKQMRDTDTIARFGGDEFVMIFNNIEDPVVVADVTSKIIESMADPLRINDRLIYITLSIGISIYPEDAENPESLLKNADAAMYQAKGDGRNTYQFYTRDMTEKAFERLMLESGLREGIKNDEFFLCYQPQFDGETGRITGIESLLRWDHPTMGVTGPNKFIHIMEETGLIVQVGRWVLLQAMTQIQAWYDAGLNPGTLAVNISLKQLNENDFLGQVKEMLEATRCQPEWLVFEVTEGLFMKNPEHTSELLKELSDLGIGIAIDDFGTGYSSLAYLKRLPIDKLKIDRSFVMDIPTDEDDVAIVKAIIALAQTLGLSLVAEGVETEEQKEFLIANGCKNIQGFLYSRPITVDKMDAMLKQDIPG